MLRNNDAVVQAQEDVRSVNAIWQTARPIVNGAAAWIERAQNLRAGVRNIGETVSNAAASATIAGKLFILND